MKQTFTVKIETDREIKPEVIVAVLAQDLPGVAKDGFGIKVTEDERTVLQLKVNRPRKPQK